MQKILSSNDRERARGKMYDLRGRLHLKCVSICHCKLFTKNSDKRKFRYRERLQTWKLSETKREVLYINFQHERSPSQRTYDVLSRLIRRRL